MAFIDHIADWHERLNRFFVDNHSSDNPIDKSIGLFLEGGAFEQCFRAALSEDLPKMPTGAERDFVRSFLQSQLLSPSRRTVAKEAAKDDALALRLKQEANELFLKGHDLQALDVYNAAVRHCSWPNRLFPVLLANRSACLFRLRCFELCLAEIDSAIENGYPAESIAKLYQRRANCAQVIEETHQSHLASYDLSPVGVDLNRWCTIVTAPVEGRHVLAEQELPAGQVVLCEQPFAVTAVPDARVQSLICDHCFAPRWLPLRRCHSNTASEPCGSPTPVVDYFCPTCTRVRYCSLKCAREAYDSYHRWECPILEILQNTGVGHLACRTVCSARRQIMDFLDSDNANSMTTPNASSLSKEDICARLAASVGSVGYGAIVTLVAHERLVSDQMFAFCLMSVFETYLLARTGFFERPAGVDPQTPQFHLPATLNAVAETSFALVACLIVRHSLQIICNAHTIHWFGWMLNEQVAEMSDVDLTAVGVGLYVQASLLNHTCLANVEQVFIGKSLLFRTTTSVGAGSELFNCYSAIAKRVARRDRRDHLSAQYHFRCSCPHCADPTLEAPWHGARCTAVGCHGVVYESPLRDTTDGQPQWTCYRCGSIVDAAMFVRQNSDVSWLVDEDSLQLDSLLTTFARVSQRRTDLWSAYPDYARSLACRCLGAGRYDDALKLLETALEVIDRLHGGQSIEALVQLARIVFACRTQQLTKRTAQQCRRYENLFAAKLAVQ